MCAMLLTITCEAENATDLGYLLHKNPSSIFEKEMWFGKARVYYPEAESSRCTAALLIEVDPVGLVRGRGSALDQYVNDRPYVASSLMSVAIGEAYRTALSGRSSERQERVEEKMDLTAQISALDCDGGEPLIRRLLEPLGYTVTVERAPLDERFPQWGESDLYTVTLQARQTVRNLIAHLYVLIPVLDNEKHYHVGEEEVEKLLRRGEGWLAAHPEKDLIARRYLVYKRRMVNAALERLREETPADDESAESEEAAIEAPVRLNEIRLKTVLAAVLEMQPAARSVIDLGCGEGRLLKLLMEERNVERIVGVDVSSQALLRAERVLKLDSLPERKRERIQLVHGSLLYRDDRFTGFDAALLVEVIEHVDPPRLKSLEQVVFGHARPRRVIVTTPNAEYNAQWESLPADRFRHQDHRFEWTRAEFGQWAESAAEAHSYSVAIHPVGPEDPIAGAPTQMAVFDRN